MEKEKVEFLSARSFLEMPLDEFNENYLLCTSGRKEVVVKCSKMIKEELEALPSDYVQPRMSDIKNYLDATGVEHTTKLKNTTIL